MTDLAAIARALLDQAADNPGGYPAAPALATGYALLAVAEELAKTRETLADGLVDIRDAVTTSVGEAAVAVDTASDSVADQLSSVADAIQGLIDEAAIGRMSWWERRKLYRRAAKGPLPGGDE